MKEFTTSRPAKQRLIVGTIHQRMKNSSSPRSSTSSCRKRKAARRLAPRPSPGKKKSSLNGDQVQRRPYPWGNGNTGSRKADTKDITAMPGVSPWGSSPRTEVSVCPRRITVQDRWIEKDLSEDTMYHDMLRYDFLHRNYVLPVIVLDPAPGQYRTLGVPADVLGGNGLEKNNHSTLSFWSEIGRAHLLNP